MKKKMAKKMNNMTKKRKKNKKNKRSLFVTIVPQIYDQWSKI